jgi:hypothetical protein
VRRVLGIALAVAVMALAACSGRSTATSVPASQGVATTQAPSGTQPPPATWVKWRHLPGVVDVVGPRSDGTFLVAGLKFLFLLRPDGSLSPFARGKGGYQASTRSEPYLALSGNAAVAGSGCSFRRDTAFALFPAAQPEVIMISPQGQARPFASLPPGGALSGIAFDGTGRFGHRLLVTATFGHLTTVYSIGCDGHIMTLATGAPPMEGGMTVAPATFGRFGGDLIAASELTGLVYAVDPSGHVVTLASSGLPSGQDIGVESAGFAPSAAVAGYLADRRTPGNKHPGDDDILLLSAADLARAGVRAGDLIIASEGGARTIDVRCAATCTVRYIAAGPAIAHGEGHIAFASS